MNLIIVSGIPCSGKSSVADALSKEFGYKVLSKDNIKERIFNQYGFESAEEKKVLDNIAEKTLYEEIEKEIKNKNNLIIDKWLQGIQPLKAISGIEFANLIFIHLIVNPDIATIRYNNRNKEGRRPLCFRVTNKFPIIQENEIIFEEDMTVEKMYEKANRPFFKDELYNLLEIDTSDIETNHAKIISEIITFVKSKVF